MSDSEQKTALATIDLLERRLQRINFLLSENAETESLKDIAAQGKNQTVLARLAEIENGLGKLASKSPALGDLLKLRMDSWEWSSSRS